MDGWPHLRVFCTRAFALIGAAPVAAAEAPPVIASIKAHPALWTVHSSKSTAYLFGSVHLLPPNIDWHSPAIDAALKASDVFVFEAPLGAEGQAEPKLSVRAKRNAAAGQGAAIASRYACAQGLPGGAVSRNTDPATLIHLLLWLAAIVMETSELQNAHYSRAGGVDMQLWAYASAEHKKIETLETIDEQLALLMPKDQKIEKEEFEWSPKELKTSSGEIGTLVDAWCDGLIEDVAVSDEQRPVEHARRNETSDRRSQRTLGKSHRDNARGAPYLFHHGRRWSSWRPPRIGRTPQGQRLCGRDVEEYLTDAPSGRIRNIPRGRGVAKQ